MPGQRSSLRTPRYESVARHGRLRRSGPIRTLVVVIATALAVVLVSGAGISAYAANSLKSQIKSVSIGPKDDKIAAGTSIGAIKGGANILLVGSDTRAGQTQVSAGVADGSRNDVTILIHISADHKQMTAVSFPRDLMVNIPSCTGTNGSTYPAETYQQFNTTLGEGLGCTVATVESMTGLTIPYAAEITFDGVIEMSNAIGGVDVCVAQAIDDSDSGLVLSAGTHTLEGLQALEFLRTRHGVGDGSDLARISSQQVFLSAMMRKIVSRGTLGNPLQLYSLASAAVRNMTLSTSLSSTNTMIELGLALKSVSLSNVVFVQYPTATDPTNVNRVVPDESDAAILNTDLKSDLKFTLGADATGRASKLSAPATVTPSTSPSASAGASAGSSSGTSAATPGSASTEGSSTQGSSSAQGSSATSATSTLPSGITGQTANQQTCSVGNG